MRCSATWTSNLRELGVSDLRVGKRVRAMWEAFHGRSTAYAQALDATDRNALAAALARNVWRGDAPDASPEMLANYVLSQAAGIANRFSRRAGCRQSAVPHPQGMPRRDT